MILDRLVLAGLTWTARAAMTAARVDRSRPAAGSAGRAAQPASPPEVVRRRKKVSTATRRPGPEEAAARASMPPVETYDLVAPDANFVHALQPDDFPS